MSQQPAAIIDDLLRQNDLGWMIDVDHPADVVIRGLLELLERVTAEYQRRCGTKFSFSPESLAAEADRNPHKIKAFLQVLGSSNSPEMLVMAWRILQGSRIRQVSMNYTERKHFELVVNLAHSEGAEDVYRSTDINDAALLRHFGIVIISGAPLFAGFYPLRIKDDGGSVPAETANA
jgi:hypothetical protein